MMMFFEFSESVVRHTGLPQLCRIYLREFYNAASYRQLLSYSDRAYLVYDDVISEVKNRYTGILAVKKISPEDLSIIILRASIISPDTELGI